VRGGTAAHGAARGGWLAAAHTVFPFFAIFFCFYFASKLE
jgi:hypothetical protein